MKKNDDLTLTIPNEMTFKSSYKLVPQISNSRNYLAIIDLLVLFCKNYSLSFILPLIIYHHLCHRLRSLIHASSFQNQNHRTPRKRTFSFSPKKMHEKNFISVLFAALGYANCLS